MSLRDLFTRKPDNPKLTDMMLEDSPVDWCAGDMARCINGDEGWTDIETLKPIEGPATGEIRRVAQVWLLNGAQGLLLEGYSAARCYCACYFQRIEPDKIEACDARFARLVKRAKVPQRV